MGPARYRSCASRSDLLGYPCQASATVRRLRSSQPRPRFRRSPLDADASIDRRLLRGELGDADCSAPRSMQLRRPRPRSSVRLTAAF